MDRGVFAASLSTIFIGFSIVIASVATKFIHPVIYSAYAYTISLVFLLILIKVFGKKFQIREIFKKFPREFSELVAFRIILGQLILLWGFSLTIAIRAVFLLRLEPLFVLIFSGLFLREKITRRKMFLIIILLLGAFIFATDLNPNIYQTLKIGDLLIILALVFLAYSYLPSTKISKSVGAESLTLTSNALGALLLIPTVFIFFPLSTLTLDVTGLYFVLLYTISFYVLGVFLWFSALRSAKPWIVASLLALEPIAGALLAFLWLNQVLTGTQFVGGIIMIAVTYFIARENIKK